MFKVLLFVVFAFNLYSGYSQRFLVAKTLKRSDVTASVGKKLGIAPLKQPDIYEKMLGATSTCSNYSGSCSPLPLTLLSFNARRIYMDKVTANWQTTNEINTKGFDVERSLGNTTEFKQVGFEDSQPGNSSVKKYEFNDNNSYEGISYYRLKLLDQDNTFTYSNIVAVKGFSKSETLSLYPNPAVNDLSLNLILNKSGMATIRIIDAAGKIIKEQKTLCVQGSNISKIDISALARGVYTLKVSREAEIAMMAKFIKD